MSPAVVQGISNHSFAFALLGRPSTEGLPASLADHLEGRCKQRRHKIGSTKTERLDVDLTAATKHCRYSRAEHPFRPHQALDQSQVRAIEGREF